MGGFQFSEDDPEGLHTLEAISSADRFNRWMYDQVRPHLKGKILEVGSGIGNISSFFLQESADITLSDVRSTYCEALRNRFSGTDVLHMDLVDPAFREIFAAREASFDTAFALNVIEHIEDDVTALANMRFLLRPGGQVLILVPAGMLLYNQLDRGLGHYRRYSSKLLTQRLQQAGFTVNRVWNFNALGIPAWMAGGLFNRQQEIGRGQMNVYDHLVPIARYLDVLTLRRLGLSLIACGINPGD